MGEAGRDNNPYTKPHNLTSVLSHLSFFPPYNHCKICVLNSPGIFIPEDSNMWQESIKLMNRNYEAKKYHNISYSTGQISHLSEQDSLHFNDNLQYRTWILQYVIWLSWFPTTIKRPNNKTTTRCLPISMYFGSKGVPIELQRTSTYCRETKVLLIPRFSVS